MKKLNNKGFTLVELLAVIVILAIVVGITMVTILPTLSNAKEKAFNTAVDTIQVFLQEEYEKCLVGDTTITGELKINFETGCASIAQAEYTKILDATGYRGDISIKSVSVDSTSNRVIVEAQVPLDASSSPTGQFKDLGNKEYTAK